MAKISRKDWSNFENLVFKMLQDIYKFEENERNHITNETKDGGFDGIFILPSFFEEEISDETIYKIIFEAKLRSAYNKDLPLSDFSKSLIIAINMSATMIIIATNVHFSKKTLLELKSYSHRTGLKIETLTSKEIMTWIRENGFDKSNHYKIRKNVLTLLKMAEQNSRKYLNENVENDIVCAINNNNVFLIGEERNTKLSILTKSLQNQTGIVVITGEPGVGKSIFTQKVLYLLEDVGINTAKIDLQQCETPRILFIKILEKIWNIPIDMLLKIEGLSEVINRIGNGKLDKNINKAVVYAFEQSDKSYEQKSKMFNHYLVEYLHQVYSVIRKKIIFCFTNINYSNNDIISFFQCFCKWFKSELSMIVEVRGSFIDNQKFSDEKLQDVITELLGLQNVILHYCIQPLLRNESREYVKFLLDNDSIDELVLDKIIDNTGNNPMLISAYINYLKNNLVDISSITAGELALLTGKAGLDFNHQIISLFIISICRKDNLFIKIFAITGILNGVVKLDHLEEVLEDDCSKQIEYLIKSNVYELKNGYLIIKHSLYLIDMQKYEYLTEAALQLLAVSIEARIANIFPDAQQNIMARIRLAKILKNNLEAIDLSLRLMEDLYSYGQYYLCYEYGLNANSLIADEKKSEGVTLSEIRILMLIIQSSFYIKGLSIKELGKRIDRVQTLMNLNRYKLQENIIYPRLKCRLYLIENQYHHQNGQFQSAYNVMKDALGFLGICSSRLNDVELAGELWLEFGIATKEVYSLEESISILRKGIKLYPNSKMLEFTLNTQLYEYYAPISPEKALRYILKNVQIESYMSPSEIYHNKVHKLNCHFMLREHDRATLEAFQLLEKTTACGLRNEEGRVYNTLACLSLLNGDEKASASYFNKGISVFEFDNYISNLWPLLLNYTTFLIHYQKWEETNKIIKKCFYIIRDKYSYRINNICYGNNTGIPKLLACLFILYENLSQLEKANSISLNIKHEVLELCNKYVKKQEISEIIYRSIYNYDGILLMNY